MAPIRKISLFEEETNIIISPNYEIEMELREELDWHTRTELLYNNIVCREERSSH